VKTIAKQKGNCKGKDRLTEGRGLTDQQIAEVDAKMTAIQAMIPLGLSAVTDALEEEVRLLAGARYQRIVTS
jgi:hypothetical protein